MRGHVPYVPGNVTRSVMGNGQNDVTGRYKCPDSRADTRSQPRLVTDPRWGARGILAVAAVLALCLIMDGAVLMLLSRWQ
jgi:hypothetical protein